MAEVEGYRDVLRDLKKAERDIRLGVRREIRGAAEPVRSTAETMAFDRISSIGVAWSRMRVGVTQKGVYVAPRKRGAKTGPQKRRNLAPLLMDRAMQPALDQHQHAAVREVAQVVDRAAFRFNRS